eukprot:TRINITY_DN674_c0_g1_i11.p3 TRINITY_DN674_c0_g1~~TRINITY_DN674_c0_g1_i11.p3  ORF type:complete len:202 (+),score=40.88 TRINITY_DN674_c0_g1_i11:1063-1668(+)
MAHVRDTIGKALSNLQYICDDHIEGTLAELNRYFIRRTNSVSRGQSLVNKEALLPPRLHGQKEGLSAKKMLFTKDIVLCPCVVNVSPSAADDFKDVVRFATQEVELSVAIVPAAGELSVEEAGLVAPADAAVVAVDKTGDAAPMARADATTALAGSSTGNAAGAAAERASEGVIAAAAAAELALVEVVGLLPLCFTPSHNL